MEKITLTMAQVKQQIKIDTEMKNRLSNEVWVNHESVSFYEIRLGQLEEIVKSGRGVFSMFENETAIIIISDMDAVVNKENRFRKAIFRAIRKEASLNSRFCGEVCGRSTNMGSVTTHLMNVIRTKNIVTGTEVFVTVERDIVNIYTFGKNCFDKIDSVSCDGMDMTTAATMVSRRIAEKLA